MTLESSTSPKKFPWKTLFFCILMTPVLLFALWTWGALTYVYARGERSGFVQKISKKGWVFKTWEGELAMANLPGTMPQIFTFTVQEDAVAHTIEQTMGKRISLSYEQHRGIPLRCFGDTQYFVTHTRMSEDTPPVR